MAKIKINTRKSSTSTKAPKGKATKVKRGKAPKGKAAEVKAPKKGKRKAPPRAGAPAPEMTEGQLRKWRYAASISGLCRTANRGDIHPVALPFADGDAWCVTFYPTTPEDDFGAGLLIRHEDPAVADDLADRLAAVLGEVVDPGEDWDAVESEHGDWLFHADMPDFKPPTARGEVFNYELHGKKVIAVCMYAGDHGASFVVRNAGKYSAKKSGKLAKELSDIMGQLTNDGTIVATKSDRGDWAHYFEVEIPEAVAAKL